MYLYDFQLPLTRLSWHFSFFSSFLSSLQQWQYLERLVVWSIPQGRSLSWIQLGPMKRAINLVIMPLILQVVCSIV